MLRDSCIGDVINCFRLKFSHKPRRDDESTFDDSRLQFKSPAIKKSLFIRQLGGSLPEIDDKTVTACYTKIYI